MSERFELPEVAAAGPPLLEVSVATGTGRKDFSVRAGEILGLAGVLGSGRTRLARSLAGLGPRSRVAARVGGKDVVPSSPRAAIANGIVYLTEDRNTDGLFGNLSVLANATAGALGKFACAGIMRLKNERRTASEMLDRLQLVARSLDAPVRVLSGGNQQKTPESNGIAEAFVKTFKRDYARLSILPDAETVIALLPAWFEDYNEVHPHSGLKFLSPREFLRLSA